MKYALALVLFFVSACDPSISCDCVVDGLCVIQDGFAISQEKLSWEIDKVNTTVNQFFPGLVLTDLIEQQSLELFFVPEERMSGLRGDYSATGAETIRIRQYNPAPGDEDIACMEAYYVFGHELLHFIARHHLGVSEELNAAHNIPHLFLMVEKSGNIPTDDVEFIIYMDTKNYCGFHYRE